MGLVKVTLVRNYRHETLGSFNTGEGAAFPESLAQTLIETGVAVKTVDRPAQHKMVTTPPSKKESKVAHVVKR